MINRRYQITDINPIIFARKILILADKDNKENVQNIEIDLNDFYKFPYSFGILEKELSNIEFTVFDSLNEQLNNTVSVLTGETYYPPSENINGINYYNNFIRSNLEFLKSGYGYAEDSLGLQKYLINYSIIKESGLQRFKVEFIVNDIINASKKFYKDYFEIQKRISDLAKSGIPGNAPSIEKQGQLFLKQIRNMKDQLGINQINVGMDDWAMRMAVNLLDNNKVMLHPFSMDYTQKSLLPILLELSGMIDIHEISLKNKIYDHFEANVQYTISTPCVINIFEDDNGFIPINTKNTLLESQIVILENIYQDLQDAMIFFKKPKLKQSFIELSIWLIKKVVFCLEEETYIRNKVIKYMQENVDAKYSQIEDNFFLPFVYERLVESYTTNRVIKKPKKSNGEMDLLFDNVIPIELKVWKRKTKRTLDKDSRTYAKNLKQAAAYANIDRLGILLILDISNLEGEVTNLENCWKVLGIDINEVLDTKVVTFIFNCNYKSPSKL